MPAMVCARSASSVVSGSHDLSWACGRECQTLDLRCLGLRGLAGQRAQCGGFCVYGRWMGASSSEPVGSGGGRMVAARVLPRVVEPEDVQTLSLSSMSRNKLFMETLEVEGKQRREEVHGECVEPVGRFEDGEGQFLQLFTDDGDSGDRDKSTYDAETGSGCRSREELGALVQSLRATRMAAADIEDIMKRSGLKLTNTDLNKVLAALEEDRKALHFFRWMRQTGRAKSNSHAYSIVLKILAEERDWETVHTYLGEMRRQSMGSKAELYAYNTLILAAGSSGSSEQATEWFNRMLSNGISPNEVTYGMLMIIYQKANRLAEAERVFAHMQACGPEPCNAYSSMIVLYMRAGLADKAEQLVSQMAIRNVMPDRENLIVQLNVFSRQGKVLECERVMEKLKESGNLPLVVYNTMIMAYGRAKMFPKVILVFRQVQESRLKGDEVTYNSLVGACGKANKLKEAVHFYEEMKVAGIAPSRATFGTLIRLYGQANNLGAVSRMLIEMTEMGVNPDARILERVVKAHDACHKLNRVPQLFSAMSEAGWLPDVECSSVILSMYLKLKMPVRALEQFEVLRQAKVLPRPSLCHNLLLGLRNARRYEDAAQLFLQLQAEGISAGLDMWCTMIDVYGWMGRVAKAEELFNQLRASTKKLDSVAYNVMLNVYMRAGIHESAIRTLKLMQEEGGFVPDAYTFHAMIRVYQKNGLQQEAADMYWAMVKAGINLDAAMSNCVINCCGRALPLEETANVFNNMLDSGFAPNAITYNVMIDLYGKQGYLQRASKVLKLAQDQGVADRISFSTLVNAYGKVKNFAKMEETLWEMQRAGFSPGLDTFNSMADAYGKAGQLSNMEDALERMERAGCEKDLSTYNILLNVYGKQRMMEELQAVLDKMRSEGLAPDKYTYNTLIKSYGNAGQPDEAVKLLREMNDAGFLPDHVTYTNLISAFEKSGNLLEAARWSLWMKQAGYKK